jgi:hypothetical protein
MMVPNYNSSKFEGTLDLILEEAGIFTPSLDKLGQIDQHTSTLSALHDDYRSELDVLNGQLATAIRRANRNLDVQLNRAGFVCVKFGSRTRTLRIKADARTQTWTVGESPFEKQFAKYNGQALKADLPTLASAISNYFSANYRAMREPNGPAK